MTARKATDSMTSRRALLLGAGGAAVTLSLHAPGFAAAPVESGPAVPTSEKDLRP
jgi:shikimate 5-dehydrogenase